jgi:hypothetical protein
VRALYGLQLLAAFALLSPARAQHPSREQVQVAIDFLAGQKLLANLIAEYQRDPGQSAQLGDVIYSTYQLAYRMPPNLRQEFAVLSVKFDTIMAKWNVLPDSFAVIARREVDALQRDVIEPRLGEMARLRAAIDSLRPKVAVAVVDAPKPLEEEVVRPKADSLVVPPPLHRRPEFKGAVVMAAVLLAEFLATVLVSD